MSNTVDGSVLTIRWCGTRSYIYLKARNKITKQSSDVLPTSVGSRPAHTNQSESGTSSSAARRQLASSLETRASSVSTRGCDGFNDLRSSLSAARFTLVARAIHLRDTSACMKFVVRQSRDFMTRIVFISLYQTAVSGGAAGRGRSLYVTTGGGRDHEGKSPMFTA